MTRFHQALIAGASSIALFGGALTLITPPANAGMSCSTFGSYTNCSGSGGSFSSNTFGNCTNYSGRDSNGNYYSGSCSTFGSYTNCN